jgi:hypothetical protein
MDVRIRFRFNKLTGEVEEFQVTDIGEMRLSEAEHNREHDRITSEVGNVIERNPRITEIFPNGMPVAINVVPESLEPDLSTESQAQRGQQTR